MPKKKTLRGTLSLKSKGPKSQPPPKSATGKSQSKGTGNSPHKKETKKSKGTGKTKDQSDLSTEVHSHHPSGGMNNIPFELLEINKTYRACFLNKRHIGDPLYQQGLPYTVETFDIQKGTLKLKGRGHNFRPDELMMFAVPKPPTKKDQSNP